jgi:hypothetical protein
LLPSARLVTRGSPPRRAGSPLGLYHSRLSDSKNNYFSANPDRPGGIMRAYRAPGSH